ncbi:MAG: glycosyltransferase family 2 protein [Butyrivibrio sp.]|nr:glycosyltransferase family 2 protein [Oribacterium sp.]MBP3816841.1 glycosyltransferase family 2 protein [Butyrivibrio sp.]
MKKIGVVVLNYKNYEDTIACVNSILKQQLIGCEVVIVDNGSNNESVHILNEKYEAISNVSVIGLSKNYGYAKGNNAGISELRKRGFSNIFVANSDLLFNSEDTLLQMMDEYESGVGLINPIIKNLNGTIDQRVAYKKKYLYLRIIRKILYLFANKPFPNKAANIDGSIEQTKELVGIQRDRYVVSGSGFLLTQDFFKFYNGLFPKTFLYFEEWGTILLLHKAGLITKIAECDYITHKGAASTPHNIKALSPERRKINIESAWKILGLLITPAWIVRNKY